METVYQQLPKSAFTSGRLEILCCLISRQDLPVSLAEICKATGLSLEHVETDLDELEGPVGGHTDNDAGAYIHRARCSSQAVFIS